MTASPIRQGRDRVGGAKRGAVIGAVALGSLGLAGAVFKCIAVEGDSCAQALLLYPTLLALCAAIWGGIIGFLVGVRRT
jgi:hypothetical protein